MGAGPAATFRPAPALLRPLGVPSRGAVQRTQTHCAEAIQRVPRSTQAGEVAPTSPIRLQANSLGAGERDPVSASGCPPPLLSQSREGADHGQLPKDCRAPCGEGAVARSQLRLTLSVSVLSTFGHVTSVPSTSRQQSQVRAYRHRGRTGDTSARWNGLEGFAGISPR